MAKRQLNRLSFRCRLALIVIVLVFVPIELMAHGLLVKKYYDLNVEILRLTAVAAVNIGAQYLPTDPHAAIREADAYAERQGVARTEIAFTELSSNNCMLTIKFVRKIPRYFAVLALGGLPTRDIEVTASARQERNAPVGHSIMFSTIRGNLKMTLGSHG